MWNEGLLYFLADYNGLDEYDFSWRNPTLSTFSYIKMMVIVCAKGWYLGWFILIDRSLMSVGEFHLKPRYV